MLSGSCDGRCGRRSDAADPIFNSDITMNEQLNLTSEWDKVFPRSGKVDHSKVTFRNRYGLTLAADMYIPKNAAGRLPAVAVCGPFGAVKEQASGLYAQTLAERGLIAIAFDPSYTGESGGEPRYVASPDINTEDFCAAVDFLSTSERVDPGRIGILGICGWGGMALNAAAVDTRIRATVASTMYDMSRVTANGYFDAMDADARHELRRRLNAQRTEDYRCGTYARAGGVADPLPADAPQFVKDYHAYYKTPRGYHRRSLPSDLCRRDPQRRAAAPRRACALALFQRGCVPAADGRQQGVVHRPRRQPYGPLRQYGADSLRPYRIVFQREPAMNLSEFLAFAATRRPLDTEEIGRFMDEMSDSARRITFELNGSYHTPDEVRALLSRLFGYEIDPSVRVFPPFYTDFGRNIAVGKGVFINACCHFQDHGGVTLGDGCQIGHNVVFATLDHGIAPAERRTTVPAPIVLGRNVWVGSNATILRGVTIGDNAVVAAGAVVAKDVEANTIVGGVPARLLRRIDG